MVSLIDLLTNEYTIQSNLSSPWIELGLTVELIFDMVIDSQITLARVAAWIFFQPQIFQLGQISKPANLVQVWDFVFADVQLLQVLAVLNIRQGNYAVDTEKINEAKVKTGNWVIKGIV